MHQRIVGDEIGSLGVAPRLDVHVDGHFLSPRHPGIVDEVIDAAKGGDCGIDGLFQAGNIGNIDVGKRADSALDTRKTNVFQFADDAFTRCRQFAVAPRHHHHLGTGECQQACDLAADAR